MLSRHLGNASVGSDNEQAVIGIQGREAVHGRLQVLLVTTHIKQVDNLGTRADDVGPDLVLLVRVRELGHVLLTVGVETNNFVCNGRRATVALLVLEIEHLRPQETISIVKRARRTRQDGRQSGLTGVNVTKHRDSQVVRVGRYDDGLLLLLGLLVASVDLLLSCRLLHLSLASGLGSGHGLFV